MTLKPKLNLHWKLWKGLGSPFLDETLKEDSLLVYVPKFLGILAGLRGSVVVRERDKDSKEPGSTLGYDFLSFFFFVRNTLNNRSQKWCQHLCKFMGTKKIFYLRKGSNSRRICLEHQYGRRDVMWKRSIRKGQLSRLAYAWLSVSADERKTGKPRRRRRQEQQRTILLDIINKISSWHAHQASLYVISLPS